MRGDFCIGADLGQSNDYTALAIVEKLHSGNPQKLTALHLRHLERYPLRTPYPEIADAVAALVQSEHLVSYTTDEMLNRMPLYPELVVDQTGVGPPVTRLLRERGPNLPLGRRYRLRRRGPGQGGLPRPEAGPRLGLRGVLADRHATGCRRPSALGALARRDAELPQEGRAEGGA